MKYNNIIEDSPEAIYTCDEKGVIKSYNKAAVNLWGREPVAGKDLWCGSWKIFDKNGGHLPLDKHPMAIALKEGRLVHGEELIVQRPDGSLKRISPYSSPLVNAQGHLTGVVSMLMEISEQQHKERQSEEKYKTLIEQASDAILIYSFDGTIYEFNKSCYTLLGYSREEYAKLKLNDILVGDIIVNQENYAAILAGNAKTLYRHLKRKDNSLIEAEVTVKMLTDGKAIAFARDITERKKAEEAIKKEKELSDSIINSLPGVFYLLDENIKFLRWNKNFETVTGYNAAEIANMHLFDFFDEGDKAIIAEKTGKVFMEGIVYAEASFYTKGHKKIPYYFTGYKIQNDEKVQLIGVGIDITERKNAEEKIKSAIEHYDILARATSDTIWDWDMINDKMQYNEGNKQMFGYKNTEVENVPGWWRKNIHPEDIENVIKALDSVYSRMEETIQLEYRFRCADNSYKYIFDRAIVLFNKCGKPIRMIGAMQDITKRKKAEKDLEEVKQELMNQKIQEQKKITRAILNAQERERRHMGEELHDNINQMLAGTKLYLSVAGNSSEVLKKAIQYPIQLIDDTMAEIRLLTSRSVTPQKNINLKEMVYLLLETLNKNTTMKTCFAYNMATDFNDDDLKLNIYRIIQEQTNNIIKHSDAGNVGILMETANNVATINITDDGKGFDATRKREGIGITNIINRVESFNGEVLIKTAAGKGCKLKITIPY